MKSRRTTFILRSGQSQTITADGLLMGLDYIHCNIVLLA